MTTTEVILGQLVESMGLAVLEALPTGSFRLFGNVPQWCSTFCPHPASDGTVRPQDVFTFIDYFLEDARRFWANPEGLKLDSGAWAETDPNGREWHLAAYAVDLSGRSLLIIRNLEEVLEARRSSQQLAHEFEIENDLLEKEVARRTDHVRRRERELALRIITATAYRDIETGAHVQRIGHFAAAVGRAIGLDPRSVEDLQLAAQMHDVGKIGVPDAILRKPGGLSTEEWRLMRAHTVIGAKVLGGSSVPMIRMAHDIAYCHHEWWDGNGYPRGISGPDIPLMARIVAVCDVFDALTTDRPYRAAMPEGEALDIMRPLNGRQFDETVFQAFVSQLQQVRAIQLRLRDEPPEARFIG